MVTAPDGIKLVNPADPDRAYLRSSLVPSLVTYAQKLLDQQQDRVVIFEIGKVFFTKSGKYHEQLKLGVAMAGDTGPKLWNTVPRKLDIHNLTGILEKLGTNYDLGQTGEVFWAELNPVKANLNTNPYSVVSIYPPIIEDVNIVSHLKYADLINRIKKLSPLINRVNLIDKYDDKLTLRITYHSDTKQLSSNDISGIRTALLSI